MRRALIPLSTAILAAALAPSARAAEPLTEAPFSPAGARSVASCLRATGAPGEVAVATASRRRDDAELWTATASGPRRVQRVPFSAPWSCPAVASDPDGGAVLARSTALGRRLLVAFRAPGGRFGAPVRVADVAGDVGKIAVAAGPSGDAVVAWVERTPARDGVDRTRVRAVLHDAGGRTGTPRVLRRWGTVPGEDDPEIAAAVDAGGHALVAFAAGRSGAIRLATGAAGAFSPAVRMPGLLAGSGLALAVGPDGRTLVAAGAPRGPVLAERPVGGGAFTVTRVRGALPTYPGSLALAAGPGGAAVVVWRQVDEPDADVFAAARAAADRAFGPVQPLWRGPSSSDFGTSVVEIAGSAGGGDGAPQALIVPDGSAVVTWIADGPSGLHRARAATGTVTTGLRRARPFGSPVRDVEAAAPVALPGGALGLAWADDAIASGVFDLPDPPARLHVAAPGAAPALDPTPPRVRLRVAPRLRLFRAQGLAVQVRCDARCDVLVRGARWTAGRTLRAGRWRRVVLGEPFGGVRTGRIPLSASATAPGGTRTAVAHESTVVVRRPPPPLPRVLDARARRRGGRIVVSWRTDRPARRVLFHATALTHHASLATAARFGRGRTRYRVVLRAGRRAAAARTVEIVTFAYDRRGAPPRTVLRIR